MTNILSYRTWRKHHLGHPMVDGYRLVFEHTIYVPNSVCPKEAALLLIARAFTDEQMKEYEFVYWYHRGSKMKQGHIEVWCRKIE